MLRRANLTVWRLQDLGHAIARDMISSGLSQLEIYRRGNGMSKC